MIQSPVEFLRKIVQINSVNPPGNELLVAEEIKSLLDNFGIENQLINFEKGRANLIARLRGKGNINDQLPAKVLGLSGHMDVVPPGQIEWITDPFSAEIKDGKIYGRGTSDMKGGLTALIFAMISLKDEGVTLNGDVKLLATAGEEVGAIGAKHLVKAGEMDEVSALIIAEPTNNNICIAEKGVFWVEITTYGKSSHGSTPTLGTNAIIHMYHILDALQNRFIMEFISDELLGEPTYNVSVIGGGSSTNVVPESCSMQIDFRTVPSQTHEEILQSLHQLIENLRSDIPNLNAEIKVLNDLPAVKTNPSDSFVKEFQDSAEEFFDSKKSLKGMTAYTDGSVFIGKDSRIPLIVFGSADTHLAHQPNEYIQIDSFLQSIEFYKHIIKKYLT